MRRRAAVSSHPPRRGTILRQSLPLDLPPGSPLFEVEIDYDRDLAPQIFMVTPNARDVETICAARCFSDESCARSYCADLIEAAREGFFVLVSELDGGAALHIRGCPGLATPGDCPTLCHVEGRQAPWGAWDTSWISSGALEEIKRLRSGPQCPLCGFPHT